MTLDIQESRPTDDCPDCHEARQESQRFKCLLGCYCLDDVGDDQNLEPQHQDLPHQGLELLEVLYRPQLFEPGHIAACRQEEAYDDHRSTGQTDNPRGVFQIFQYLFRGSLLDLILDIRP